MEMKGHLSDIIDINGSEEASVRYTITINEDEWASIRDIIHINGSEGASLRDIIQINGSEGASDRFMEYFRLLYLIPPLSSKLK